MLSAAIPVAHPIDDARQRTSLQVRLSGIALDKVPNDEKGELNVLFKEALTTGWDCPRAEVMFSQRVAGDHTYIAQLIGRMVRTPLARRIAVEKPPVQRSRFGGVAQFVVTHRHPVQQRGIGRQPVGFGVVGERVVVPLRLKLALVNDTRLSRPLQSRLSRKSSPG